MTTTAPNIPATALSNEEILRYSRHLIMARGRHGGTAEAQGGEGACIGTGGLGSPLALYLTARRWEHARLVDFDVGGLHQPAAADHPTRLLTWQAEAGFG